MLFQFVRLKPHKMNTHTKTENTLIPLIPKIPISPFVPVCPGSPSFPDKPWKEKK